MEYILSTNANLGSDNTLLRNYIICIYILLRKNHFIAFYCQKITLKMLITSLRVGSTYSVYTLTYSREVRIQINMLILETRLPVKLMRHFFICEYPSGLLDSSSLLKM